MKTYTIKTTHPYNPSLIERVLQEYPHINCFVAHSGKHDPSMMEEIYDTYCIDVTDKPYSEDLIVLRTPSSKAEKVYQMMGVYIYNPHVQLVQHQTTKVQPKPQPKPQPNPQPKPLTNKEIFKEMVNEGTPFILKYHNNTVFDSTKQPLKNLHVEDEGILFNGKTYDYINLSFRHKK